MGDAGERALDLAIKLINANADALDERGFRAWAAENRKMARKIRKIAEGANQ